MAMVQCKACGKIYDYEKNGCCPSCGAYNRPPRRERVDADGTVHHLTGQERRSVPRGGQGVLREEGVPREEGLLRG